MPKCHLYLVKFYMFAKEVANHRSSIHYLHLVNLMIYAKDLNLKYTIQSGQPLAFYSDLHIQSRVERLGYPTGKGRISLKYDKESGRISYTFAGRYTDASAAKEIRIRLGLNQDIKAIYKEINTDQFMASAIAEFYGMRITGNEPWEATLCFVMSQFNNIKRIRDDETRLLP